MLPFPLPLMALVMLIQLGTPARLQLQLAGADTVKLPLAPPAGKLVLDGVTLQPVHADEAWLSLAMPTPSGVVADM
jgi:hypothetical protein